MGAGCGAGYVMIGAAAHPAAHLPQAPLLMLGRGAQWPSLGQMAVGRSPSPVILTVGLPVGDRPRSSGRPYNSSNQLHALTTVGQFACLAWTVRVPAWLWRHGRRLARPARRAWCSCPRSRWSRWRCRSVPPGCTCSASRWISSSAPSTSTRLADSPALHDMTYHRAAAVLPAGWFWIGGRLADLTGMPAWEMFKPWAIISITAAIAHRPGAVVGDAALRVRARVCPPPPPAVTLAYTSAEPYAAVITVLLPPVFVLAWSGLHGAPAAARWARRHRRRAVPRRGGAVLLPAARLRGVHRRPLMALAPAPWPGAASSRC